MREKSGVFWLKSLKGDIASVHCTIDRSATGVKGPSTFEENLCDIQAELSKKELFGSLDIRPWVDKRFKFEDQSMSSEDSRSSLHGIEGASTNACFRVFLTVSGDLRA